MTFKFENNQSFVIEIEDVQMPSFQIEKQYCYQKNSFKNKDCCVIVINQENKQEDKEHYLDSEWNYFGYFDYMRNPIDGEMKYSNGDIFKGKLENILPKNGELKYSNGDVFNGSFQNGLPQDGELKYSNGNVFNGKFEDGLPRKGELTFNGWEFIGNFENGKPKFGTLFGPDGDYNHGNFDEIIMIFNKK
jgi:hypothetical protein